MNYLIDSVFSLNRNIDNINYIKYNSIENTMFYKH